MPHLYGVGQETFLTWRLHDSLPAGPSYLTLPQVAEIVEEAILDRQERDYRLHAWVIMPNHVHLLITPWYSLSETMPCLMASTARECTRVLGLADQPFWDESQERLVRDPAEFDRLAAFIQMSPVKAGLAKRPDEYRWSSSWRGVLAPPALPLGDGQQFIGLGGD
jgi:REP element-mobilizing transposase RayT